MTSMKPIRPNPTSEHKPLLAVGQNGEEDIETENEELQREWELFGHDGDELPMEVEAKIPEEELEAEDKQDNLTNMQGMDDSAAIICEPRGNSRIPKALNSPIRPSAEAVDEHYITHQPYRDWCPVCV